MDETAVLTRARKIIETATLRTNEQLVDQVRKQLARLAYEPNSALKCDTIQAIIDCEVLGGGDRKDALGRKLLKDAEGNVVQSPTISSNNFYNKKKGWFSGNELFREVLEAVLGLHLRWKAEVSHRTKLDRYEKFLETAFTVGESMMNRAKDMAEHPLFEIKQEFEDEEGRKIIQFIPNNNWKPSDTAPIATAAIKVVQTALGIDQSGVDGRTTNGRRQQADDGVTAKEPESEPDKLTEAFNYYRAMSDEERAAVTANLRVLSDAKNGE